MIRRYGLKTRIPLPGAYSREFIPVERSQIPTPETAMKWPYLKDIAHHIHPLMNCQVRLLIGYDCPLALAPKKLYHLKRQ